MLTYNQIKKKLTESKAKVIFTKADGTERTLICTLNMDIIPKDNHPKGSKDIIVNTDVIKAFDLEINQWRSFRIDSVKQFDVL